MTIVEFQRVSERDMMFKNRSWTYVSPYAASQGAEQSLAD